MIKKYNEGQVALSLTLYCSFLFLPEQSALLVEEVLCLRGKEEESIQIGVKYTIAHICLYLLLP